MGKDVRVSSRWPPGRIVAVASAVIIVVALALWASRSMSTTEQTRSGATASSTVTPGDTGSTPDSGLPTIAESQLPQIARDTLALIRAGGPYPFEEDDRTFQNREGILPDRQRGYYREYTVKKGTRGDRGPLRIVRGSGGDAYWTEDHYDSFRQIEEGR